MGAKGCFLAFAVHVWDRLRGGKIRAAADLVFRFRVLYLLNFYTGEERLIIMAKVIIIMGSDSDLPQMKAAADILDELGVSYDLRVSSAHRTPERTHAIVSEGEKNGAAVFIAAAGGAAHLAGVVASATTLPVIGVPIMSKFMSGLDSLLSTVQMPPGIPVATVAVGGAKNAGILAAQILAGSDEALKEKLVRYRLDMAETVKAKDEKLASMSAEEYLEQKK